MSDTLKLEIPIDDDLLHKSKPKGIRSIVSTFPPLNKAKTTLKKSDPNENDKQSEKEQVVVNRFITSKCIGNGGFGEIYLAKDREQNDLLVAVKFERTNTQRRQLPIEKCVFEIMHDSIYIPRLFYFGTHKEYTILAMDLLGPSVEDLLSFTGRKFSSKTVCMIMEQVLRGIEALHNRSIIHRDLKPDNFLFGLGAKSHLVHLIDFGLCKNFRHPLTYEHNSYRIGKTLTGTARYCSLYTHHGIEQSRRDDIQCLSYIMIYLAKGFLPWMSIKMSHRKKRNEKLMEIKESLTANELCKDLPYEFELFYKYSRTLSYTQRPDYGYLRNLFLAVINSLNETFDYIYDWHLIVKMFKENLKEGRPILTKRKD
ncbi:unnamed protein product [Adineta ricciae]|uniref:non-specific serine/threonine protein kinase n=1 Tax=Adineta ricciae TaxID=249248 RepID=A0A813RZF2_ADIRI|nr:unnamed protein product [Adineta ricciae]CAF0861500.1 unnamed protein product [Adineta ricciae]